MTVNKVLSALLNAWPFLSQPMGGTAGVLCRAAGKAVRLGVQRRARESLHAAQKKVSISSCFWLSVSANKRLLRLE